MMKKTTASTPQGLASANAAYCQRMAQLAQESQQRWVELGRRLAGGNAEQYMAALAPLQQSGNWQEIAPALGEMTRKQWQSQLEASQAITHALLEEQATLAAGMSEAMRGWLKQATGGAMGIEDTPMAQIWKTLSNQMASACSAMRDASQPGAHHDG
ncbi:hypothetical protein IAG32_03125 [Achromobacter xylosoxidans]|nr:MULTISPECIES: hypothetical protein [Achromobacter]MBC9903190.1 hypothetical protein [Achromobacter xylosoxidans]MBD0867780.1 hypothetical protein [Achromobacter xylosoxidans]MDH1301932.1 hypothetical protein [Achromobacter sp. GD03932]QNP86746.1 hypothetical protein IAG39_04250 [Achromobacter xylosoxidans]